MDMSFWELHHFSRQVWESIEVKHLSDWIIDFKCDADGIPISGVRMPKSQQSNLFKQLNVIKGVNYGLGQQVAPDGSVLIFNYTNNFLNGYLISYNSLQGNQGVYFYDMDYMLVNTSFGPSKFTSRILELSEEDTDLESILASNQDLVKIIKDFEKSLEIEENAIWDLRWGLLNDSPYYSHEENLRRNKVVWAYERKILMSKGVYTPEADLLPYYILQNKLKGQIVKVPVLKDEVKYIAGVDVAYDNIALRMVGAVVVLDADTLEVVDSAWHEMDVVFPYIPGLFSFREVPPLLEAFNKIKIRPDLIVCDAHGISHPNGVGMASHLGLELDIPTIGCAKRRLIGRYDPEVLGQERGSEAELNWNNEKIGVALRTQTGIKPVFVSIGHKIDLETAIKWVLKLTPSYRLPETTRKADEIVNRIIKQRTNIVDLFGDDEM